jgi:photosystem II stability/assembly factor-like uncharacterized protein
MKRLLTFAVILLAHFCRHGYAQWVQTAGPVADFTRCFAVSGTNIFAGGDGYGIYLSTNEGTSWRVANAGLPTNTSVYCFAVSGVNLFAGTSGQGIFLSTDNGSTWANVNSGLTSAYVTSLAVLGTNLIAGTASSGVFISTNNGNSWTQSKDRFGPNNSVLSVVVSGTNLFAGTLGSGVFLSTNQGANWVNTGLANNSVYSLAVIGTNLFAGTESSLFLPPGTGGVFLSTDNGTSWTPVNTGLVRYPGDPYATVLALAASGTNLFAGTRQGGVFLSTNNGSSWTAVDSGLVDYTGYDFWALAVIDTSLLAASNGLGVFRSTNNGTTWRAVNTGLAELDVRSLSSSGKNLFAGTSGGGVFLSTNNGTSWTAVNSDLTRPYVNALAVSGANLFAGTDEGGVFLSTNNGTSWNAVNSGLTNTYVGCFAVSGTNLFAGTAGGVFRSTNNGTSWNAVNTGLTNTFVLALAVSGTNLLAGIGGGSGVFLSTNNGTSWTAASTGLTNNSVFALAVSGTNLFAGTGGGGVFLSTDSGTSWTDFNSGLPMGTSVQSLAVGADGTAGPNLFAGTLGRGVWRRPLSQMVTPNGASFGGTVTDGSTGNPISGATVTWGTYGTTTSGSGTYSFNNVVCQSETLSVAKPGYLSFSQSYSPVCLASSQKDVQLVRESYSFEFFNGSFVVSIGQTLTLQGRILNQNGIPSANVTIYVEDPIRLQSVIVDTTDSQGQFSHVLQPRSFIPMGVHTLVFYAGSSEDYQPVRVLVTNPNSIHFEMNNPNQNTGLGPVAIPLDKLEYFAAVDHALETSQAFNLSPSLVHRIWGLMVRASAFTYADPEAVIHVFETSPVTSRVVAVWGASCVATAPLAALLPPAAIVTGSICTDAEPILLPEAISLAAQVAIRTQLNKMVEAGLMSLEERDAVSAGVEDGFMAISVVEIGPGTLLTAADYAVTHFGEIDVNKPLQRAVIRDANGGITGVAFCGVPTTSPDHALMMAMRISPGATLVERLNNSLPTTYALHQNYPNPFNPTTTIEFALPRFAFVTLRVYDLLGRQVGELVNEKLTAGTYKTQWDARGVASGVYLYRLMVGDFLETKKLLLLR